MENAFRQLLVIAVLALLYILPSWLPAKRWLGR